MTDDFDALIEAGALDDVDPVAVRDGELWAEYQAAIRADADLLIDLAVAASAVARGDKSPAPQAVAERRSRARLARRARESATAARTEPVVGQIIGPAAGAHALGSGDTTSA